jgi:hypothetical protein
MSALNTLQFKGYTLRPAGPADLDLATAWTAADPDHAGQIGPQFWLEQQLGVDCVLVSDGKGPVFFFKAVMLVYKRRRGPLPLQLVGLSEQTITEVSPIPEKVAAQVFIQFMPCMTEEDRERTREALIQGMEWLEPVLEQGGAEEIFFDSRNKKLIAFCVKRLGFQNRPEQRFPGGDHWAPREYADLAYWRLRKRLRATA